MKTGCLDLESLVEPVTRGDQELCLRPVISLDTKKKVPVSDPAFRSVPKSIPANNPKGARSPISRSKRSDWSATRSTENGITPSMAFDGVSAT